MRPLRLMYVTDPRTSALDVVRVARAAVEGGADSVQVRGASTDRELFELARAIVGAVGGRAAVLVNERFDVAIAAGAAGVHLKDQGLRPRAVSDAAIAAGQSAFRVGVSAHDGAGLIRAAREGASHATIGPLRHSPGKRGAGSAAVESWLEEARIAGAMPASVLVLGGVTSDDAAWAHSLRRPGECIGLAAIRLFQDAPGLDEVSRRAAEVITALG